MLRAPLEHIILGLTHIIASPGCNYNSLDYLYDGSYNKVGSGIRCVIVALNGPRVERSVRFKFRVSINEVEYDAVVNAFRAAKD